MPETKPSGPETDNKTDIIKIPSGIKMTERVKDAWDSLSSASKDFAGKLWGKIKSSETVQNIADKYKVWRNEGLAKRAENKITKLNTEAISADATSQKSRAAIEKNKANFSTLEEKLTKAGLKLTDSDRSKFNKETEAHLMAEKRQSATGEKIKNKADQVKSTKEQYEKKVSEAKDRLTGKLETKISAHEKTIASFERELNNTNSNLGRTQESIKDINESMEELTQLADETDSKSLKKTIKNKLSELSKQRAENKKTELALRKENDKITSKKEKIESKIADLNTKIGQIDPEKIRPENEDVIELQNKKPAGGEITAPTFGREFFSLGKAEISEDGSIKLNLNGGEIKINGNFIKGTKSGLGNFQYNIDAMDSDTTELLKEIANFIDKAPNRSEINENLSNKFIKKLKEAQESAQ